MSVYRAPRLVVIPLAAGGSTAQFMAEDVDPGRIDWLTSCYRTFRAATVAAHAAHRALVTEARSASRQRDPHRGLRRHCLPKLRHVR